MRILIEFIFYLLLLTGWILVVRKLLKSKSKK